METDNSNDSYTAKKWSAKLLTISGEEPMIMRALDAVAYNKALDAVYDDPDLRQKYRQRVRWWQFLLRNWCPFQATNFQNFRP